MCVYGGSCAITSCRVSAVLEAGHIKPYSDFTDYAPSNGILLRADIHTLFDLNLIKIDPDKMCVRVHKSITDPVYQTLNGQPVRQPKNKQSQLYKEFLIARWQMPV